MVPLLGSLLGEAEPVVHRTAIGIEEAPQGRTRELVLLELEHRVAGGDDGEVAVDVVELHALDLAELVSGGEVTVIAPHPLLERGAVRRRHDGLGVDGLAGDPEEGVADEPALGVVLPSDLVGAVRWAHRGLAVHVEDPLADQAATVPPVAALVDALPVERRCAVRHEERVGGGLAVLAPGDAADDPAEPQVRGLLSAVEHDPAHLEPLLEGLAPGGEHPGGRRRLPSSVLVRSRLHDEAVGVPLEAATGEAVAVRLPRAVRAVSGHRHEPSVRVLLQLERGPVVEGAGQLFLAIEAGHRAHLALARVAEHRAAGVREGPGRTVRLAAAGLGELPRRGPRQLRHRTAILAIHRQVTESQRGDAGGTQGIARVLVGPGERGGVAGAADGRPLGSDAHQPLQPPLFVVGEPMSPGAIDGRGALDATGLVPVGLHHSTRLVEHLVLDRHPQVRRQPAGPGRGEVREPPPPRRGLDAPALHGALPGVLDSTSCPPSSSVDDTRQMLGARLSSRDSSPM